MAVDPNEITGFVLNCVNEGWLLSLERMCRERIEALAGMRSRPAAAGAPLPVVLPKPNLVQPARPPAGETPPFPVPGTLPVSED